MSLDYLEFDYSEDTQGLCTFDAMASVAPAQVPAVLAEIGRVLDWAFTHFAGGRGALDEGMQWDFDLQSQQEFSVQDRIAYDEATGRVRVQAGQAGQARHTLTLSLSATPDFAEAFRAAFLQEDAGVR